MYFRQLLNEYSSCASYVLGCTGKSQLAVVDPHIDLVDAYIEAAAQQGAPIVAVFDTHVQADHISGMRELIARTGAASYLPEGARTAFDHHARGWRVGSLGQCGDSSAVNTRSRNRAPFLCRHRPYAQ